MYDALHYVVNLHIQNLYYSCHEVCCQRDVGMYAATLELTQFKVMH